MFPPHLYSDVCAFGQVNRLLEGEVKGKPAITAKSGSFRQNGQLHTVLQLCGEVPGKTINHHGLLAGESVLAVFVEFLLSVGLDGMLESPHFLGTEIGMA